jgi:hypothetical protein
MRRLKVMAILFGFTSMAVTLALCSMAGFPVLRATELALTTTEESLGKIDPGLIPSTITVSRDGTRLAFEAYCGGKQWVVTRHLSFLRPACPRASSCRGYQSSKGYANSCNVARFMGGQEPTELRVRQSAKLHRLFWEKRQYRLRWNLRLVSIMR